MPEEIRLVVLEVWLLRCAVSFTSMTLAICILSIAKQSHSCLPNTLNVNLEYYTKRDTFQNAFGLWNGIISRCNELNFTFCFGSVFLKKGIVYSASTQGGNDGNFPPKWLLQLFHNAVVKRCCLAVMIMKCLLIFEYVFMGFSSYST